jgi:hypothetical protein
MLSSDFIARISFKEETKKCPEPTAGSQIFKEFIILFATFLASLSLYSILSLSSSRLSHFQPFASLNFYSTALCMVSLAMYIVIKPGVK